MMNDKLFIGFLSLSVAIHLAVFSVSRFSETGLRIESTEMAVSLVRFNSLVDLTHQPATPLKRPDLVALREKTSQDDPSGLFSDDSDDSPEQVKQTFLSLSETNHLKEDLLAAMKVTGSIKVLHSRIESATSGYEVSAAAPLSSGNRPPIYPRIARRQGWEGEVWLIVRVAKTGRVVQVEVDSSSGYNVLDKAALETVRSWSFRSARFGMFAVEGEVRVPVRFELRDS